MDFVINSTELEALYGLLHFQQLTYLRGIRPYMDVQTGMVGIKRKISYQSIAEQLYIEAQPGIKSVSYSRAQIRRALSTLERSGLITIQLVVSPPSTARITSSFPKRISVVMKVFAACMSITLTSWIISFSMKKTCDLLVGACFCTSGSTVVMPLS